MLLADISSAPIGPWKGFLNWEKLFLFDCNVLHFVAGQSPEMGGNRASGLETELQHQG
jgi:hypothetical protein